jgi:hypothetical protein
MARKTEVYTWRVTRALKSGLEEAARAGSRSVSQLLDEIVAAHLEGLRAGDGDSERQRRLQERAARFAGCISGRASRRSESARERVRARLKAAAGRRPPRAR